jgi:hypothetical protein
MKKNKRTNALKKIQAEIQQKELLQKLANINESDPEIFSELIFDNLIDLITIEGLED